MPLLGRLRQAVLPPPRVRTRRHCFSDDSEAVARSRRGFTLVEMIGTCFVLGILFSITVPMFMVVARERRSTEQRQLWPCNTCRREFTRTCDSSRLEGTDSWRTGGPGRGRRPASRTSRTGTILSRQTNRRRTTLAANHCLGALEDSFGSVCLSAADLDLGLSDE